MRISDNMSVDPDGHMSIRMGDNMDMETGEQHITSSWADDDRKDEDEDD